MSLSLPPPHPLSQINNMKTKAHSLCSRVPMPPARCDGGCSAVCGREPRRGVQPRGHRGAVRVPDDQRQPRGRRPQGGPGAGGRGPREPGAGGTAQRPRLRAHWTPPALRCTLQPRASPSAPPARCPGSASCWSAGAATTAPRSPPRCWPTGCACPGPPARAARWESDGAPGRRLARRGWVRGEGLPRGGDSRERSLRG